MLDDQDRQDLEDAERAAAGGFAGSPEVGGGYQGAHDSYGGGFAGSPEVGGGYQGAASNYGGGFQGSPEVGGGYQGGGYQGGGYGDTGSMGGGQFSGGDSSNALSGGLVVGDPRGQQVSAGGWGGGYGYTTGNPQIGGIKSDPLGGAGIAPGGQSTFAKPQPGAVYTQQNLNPNYDPTLAAGANLYSSLPSMAGPQPVSAADIQQRLAGTLASALPAPSLNNPFDNPITMSSAAQFNPMERLYPGKTRTDRIPQEQPPGATYTQMTYPGQVAPNPQVAGIRSDFGVPGQYVAEQINPAASRSWQPQAETQLPAPTQVATRDYAEPVPAETNLHGYQGSPEMFGGTPSYPAGLPQGMAGTQRDPGYSLAAQLFQKMLDQRKPQGLLEGGETTPLNKRKDQGSSGTISNQPSSNRFGSGENLFRGLDLYGSGESAMTPFTWALPEGLFGLTPEMEAQMARERRAMGRV